MFDNKFTNQQKKDKQTTENKHTKTDHTLLNLVRKELLMINQRLCS